jgi:hypothetical protein
MIPSISMEKFVLIKAMNRLKTISDLRGELKKLIENELPLLREEGL